jgi:hypothetical protein
MASDGENSGLSFSNPEKCNLLTVGRTSRTIHFHAVKIVQIVWGMDRNIETRTRSALGFHQNDFFGIVVKFATML